MYAADKMTTAHTDSLEALSWLVDAGADEALLEEPVNRFVAPKPREPVQGEIPARAPSRVSAQSPQGFREAPRILPQQPAPSPAASDDAIGSAMEIAARANTLAELKASLEGYEGCLLKKHATNTVFADGTPDHGIMFIGEAPGHDEDRMGLPFVGRAGKLLDKMLAAIHLDRTKVYIVNVLPWRPPDNRNPEPVEVAKCIPFLRRHIELARPKILILLGAVSARHVLGQTDGIMRLRGRWLEYHVAGQMIPVMPTLHPAYLLRRPIDKRLAWRDLQQIASKVKTFS
jgi:uracil-DNA glycosylase